MQLHQGVPCAERSAEKLLEKFKILVQQKDNGLELISKIVSNLGFKK